jgi:hypothetical protein
MKDEKNKNLLLLVVNVVVALPFFIIKDSLGIFPISGKSLIFFTWNIFVISIFIRTIIIIKEQKGTNWIGWVLLVYTGIFSFLFIFLWVIVFIAMSFAHV